MRESPGLVGGLAVGTAVGDVEVLVYADLVALLAGTGAAEGCHHGVTAPGRVFGDLPAGEAFLDAVGARI